MRFQWRGIYFDGVNPVPVSAIFHFAGGSYLLEVEGREAVSFSVNEVQVAPRIGNIARAFALPGHARFETPDNDGVDAFLGTLGRPELASRLDSSWRLAGISAIALLSLLFFVYWVVLPKASDRLARAVPLSFAREFSAATRYWAEQRDIFGRANVEPQQEAKAEMAIARLRRAFPGAELNFRIVGGKLGANAFALPDGTIYLTDKLLLLLGEDELYAVLLHELGHVDGRHGLSLLIETSLVSVVVFAVAGGDWTSLPMAFLNSAYSRRHESDADTYAKLQLRREGISPSVFVNALEKLQKEAGEENRWIGFISSHPLTEERRRALLMD